MGGSINLLSDMNNRLLPTIPSIAKIIPPLAGMEDPKGHDRGEVIHPVSRKASPFFKPKQQTGNDT